MATIMISGITQKQPNINIRIKVLKVETISRKNFDAGKPFLDLVVSDEEGSRIGVTIKNFLKDKYQSMLKLQKTFYLKNAFVINNPFKGSGVHWEHESKLMITPKTTVVDLTHSEWVGPDGFKLVSFTDLNNCNLKEGATADVIGRLVYFSEVKKYGDSDQLKSKFMNLDLKDLDGVLIGCTIWGQFHIDFLEYMKSVTENQCVIVIIHMGKTRKYGHKLTVTTDWGNSNLLLDAPLKCVTDFRKSLLEQHATDDSAGSLAPTQTPPTNPLEQFFKDATCVGCSELAITAPGLYIVQAKIIAVLPDEPWYYIACKKCHHKAPTVEDETDLTLDIDAQLALKRKCGGKCRGNPNVCLRFKVCVRVEDAVEDLVGTATFTVFETIVSKYVTTSAYDLQKSLSDDQDQPDDLDKLLHNTMLFKVEVSNYTLKAVHPTYTVKDATVETAFVEKFLEDYKKEQRGLTTGIKSSQTPISHCVSQSTNCGSSGTVEPEESVNLSNNTGYTPPKKMIKIEPGATPISEKSSSTKAKKALLSG